MMGSPNRRGFLGGMGLGLGLAAGGALTPSLTHAADTGTTRSSATHSRQAHDLAAAIDAMPMVDVHSHPFPALTPITEEAFLETLALSAWMLDAYFPGKPGEQTLYAQWRAADAPRRAQLDRQYGIQRRFDEVVSQMRSTLLVEYLIREMAAFFRCKPTLAQVIGARNEYTRAGGHWRYVNDLFGSVRLEAALVQSGHGTLAAWTEPEPTMAQFSDSLHAEVYEVAGVGGYDLLGKDMPFADLVSAYRTRLTQQARTESVVAFKSSVVKVSGADVQPVTPAEAERAWEQLRKLKPEELIRIRNRTWRPDFSKVLQDFMVWEACAVAYELDVPLHIHSGNGEGQDKISSHYPYKLENVLRYPVELPQKPVQIVLLHAGYPHHTEAAYLTHIFPNAWFDLSILTPFSNRGLKQRLLEIFELAPLAKIMYGSDAYHVPELSYLAAKWAKRHLGAAFATLLEEGVLGMDDAVRYSRMILAENARRLHKLERHRPLKTQSGETRDAANS